RGVEAVKAVNMYIQYLYAGAVKFRKIKEIGFVADTITRLHNWGVSPLQILSEPCPERCVKTRQPILDISNPLNRVVTTPVKCVDLQSCLSTFGVESSAEGLQIFHLPDSQGITKEQVSLVEQELYSVFDMGNKEVSACPSYIPKLRKDKNRGKTQIIVCSCRSICVTPHIVLTISKDSCLRVFFCDHTNVHVCPTLLLTFFLTLPSSPSRVFPFLHPMGYSFLVCGTEGDVTAFAFTQPFTTRGNIDSKQIVACGEGTLCQSLRELFSFFVPGKVINVKECAPFGFLALSTNQGRVYGIDLISGFLLWCVDLSSIIECTVGSMLCMSVHEETGDIYTGVSIHVGGETAVSKNAALCCISPTGHVKAIKYMRGDVSAMCVTGGWDETILFVLCSDGMLFTLSNVLVPLTTDRIETSVGGSMVALEVTFDTIRVVESGS
ncbi:hypothetical protein ADUPG1_007394, partial [Aduncisulcus paluster]